MLGLLGIAGTHVLIYSTVQNKGVADEVADRSSELVHLIRFRNAWVSRVHTWVDM